MRRDPPRGIAITAEQRAALFAAVLVHDTIDLAAAPPAAIALDCEPERFARFFALARAMWEDGADRRALARIARDAMRRGALSPPDAAAFGDIRARFKQLRFAYVMFGDTHACPAALDRITRAMGQLQDALRHGRRRRARLRAASLRLHSARLPYALMVRGIDRFRAGGGASFRGFVAGQMAALRTALAVPEITGKHFHDTRKIVSRFVAMYDCIGTLEPSPETRAVARYLGTINGLMGGLHDELVARRLAGTQDYHATHFALPEPIAVRLRALERAFAAAAAA